MKKILVVFTALFFAVSCDSGVKFTNPNDTNADITDSSDSDDIEISDADMSDNDSDIADSGSDSVDSTPDDGDSQPDDMNNTDPKPDDTDQTDTLPDNADSADDEDTVNPDVTDTGETVGETHVTDCTGLPENASWNTVSAIVQTWNGEKWVPSSVASFNLEGSEDECRFKCDINYGWNGSICVADVKNAYCDAKPENSVWNDGGRNGTFAQTWSGSSWLPESHAAVHSTSAVECGFVCVFGYVWDGSYCEVAPTQTVECTGLPMNGAEWNTASTITQTWDGEKWIPESTVGVYNENPSTDECRFKCKDHYSWKNSECTADKKNSPCMNLPTNGQWNTAVSIEQTWNGSDWQPSTTGVYNETASSKECRFVCKINYKWNASTSKCDPEINVADCTGLPANAVWNGSGKFEQTWNGQNWYPATYEATYNKTAGICTFICDTGFIWDETSCVSAPTREAGCQDKPENTVWNTVDKIIQTHNGADWEPSTNPVYNEEASDRECRFKCASAEYTWNGTACITNYNESLFAMGPYTVNVIDENSDTYGAPRQFRIYEPTGAEGNIPVIHFLHGFMYKIAYYDDFLTHLASHGFIVVSSQSDHVMIGGDTTIVEAEKVITFLNWLKQSIQSRVSVIADVEHFGVSGHSRGGKVTNRVLNTDPAMATSFFGVDPVDSAPPMGGSSDPTSLSDPVQFTGESMFLGTEKATEGTLGQACAPAGENSVNFYAHYPSPSHHIIAAGVGHADMVDPADVSSCGMYCSTCKGSGNTALNQQFITYTGGLMVAFFNATLKGQTQYETLLNDSWTHPFATTIVEHK